MLGFGEPGRDFGIVDRPISPDAVQVCSFKVDVAVSGRGAPPEIRFPARRFAALPVPIRTGSIGVSDIVLEQIFSFAVLRFFNRVRFLMGFALESQWISKTSILQV